MTALRVHVVGAGLAGLSAAVRLIRAGARVTLFEAAPRAGGRCRSFHDPILERTLDNGPHLVLGAYGETLAFLDTVGARDGLSPASAEFPMIDVKTGRRWAVRPGMGFTLGIVPDIARLITADARATVEATLGGSPRFDELWAPLTLAVLNTPPEAASARLLRTAVVRAFARGRAAGRPLLARSGLSAALIDPALVWLAANGADIRLNAPLRAIERGGGKVGALHFKNTRTQDFDAVILALPPRAVNALLPGLAPDFAHHAIVSAHFRLDRSAPLPSLLGMIGGTGQWLFGRGDVVSVTASAADDLAQQSAANIAALMWRDAAKALGAAARPLPPFRVIKERFATIAQGPELVRPGPATRFSNLFVAGDWTATGLPATIEGAVWSGRHAADAVKNLEIPL